MAKYDIQSIDFPSLEGLVDLPKYQRPLVWTKTQKNNFIDNIRHGYPFGSLLLYRYKETDEKYTLIDGQQRYTTLIDYASHPENYFPVDASDSPHIAQIMKITGISSQAEDVQATLRAKIVTAIKELFHEQASSAKVDSSFLVKRIREEWPSMAQNFDTFEALNSIQGDLINELTSFIDLDKLQIPCVIFRGEKSELPEVFANVNLGGTKLTKYQVFAAQWNRYTVSLPYKPLGNEILDKTIERYESLTEERGGLVIEEFDPVQMKNDRQVTLPELCHALGQMIVERVPACLPRKTLENDNAVDTIGYNTLAIVFGIKPQEIAGKPSVIGKSNGLPSLPDSFENANFENSPDAIEELIKKILDEYAAINGRFERHLRKPGNRTDYETSRSNGQLQFLSFFAALWTERYGKIKSITVEPRPNSKTGHERTLKRIFPCFILDMLTGQWKGSGDSRLGNYIDGTLDYLSTASFSKEKLEVAVNSYLDEIRHTESINKDPVALTLLTTASNMHRSLYQEDTYDVEHLISRDALQKKTEGVSRYKAFKIAGGSLGNLAYLSADANRAKGSTPLPESSDELFRFEGSREFIEDGIALVDANHNLKSNQPDAAKRFIEQRARMILDSIIEILCSEAGV